MIVNGTSFSSITSHVLSVRPLLQLSSLMVAMKAAQADADQAFREAHGGTHPEPVIVDGDPQVGAPSRNDRSTTPTIVGGPFGTPIVPGSATGVVGGSQRDRLLAGDGGVDANRPREGLRGLRGGAASLVVSPRE